MSYYEPKPKIPRSKRRLVSTDIPDFLKKRGITKVYDNLRPGEELNVSKAFALLYFPEIMKQLRGRKQKK